MPKHMILLVVLALYAPAAIAGVVVETDITITGEGSATETMYVEGELFRTDPASIGDGKMSVIFRDDTMWFLDHDKKLAQKVDRRAVADLAEQLDEMMRQLEQMPPQQREMMRKMMSGKMQGMEELPDYRVQVGETTRIAGVPCTMHTLYADEDKVQETCAADDSNVPELREAMGAVRAMGRFAEDLRKMASNLPFGDVMKHVQAAIPEVDGFPVRTRWFDDEGTVTRESTLRGIEARDLEPSLFDVPKSYKVKDLGKELSKGR
jgi:hypothetical protein